MADSRADTGEARDGPGVFCSVRSKTVLEKWMRKSEGPWHPCERFPAAGAGGLSSGTGVRGGCDRGQAAPGPSRQAHG